MHYADLSACTYFPKYGEALVAVGWLAAGEPYATGPVGREFFDRLFDLLVDPWAPLVVGGRERCGFCRFTGGPVEMLRGQDRIELGSNNLFVPGSRCVYVAPSLLAHYIDAHEYAPPPVFQAAVMGCPAMESDEYFGALTAAGLVGPWSDARGRR